MRKLIFQDIRTWTINCSFLLLKCWLHFLRTSVICYFSEFFN